VLANAKYTNSMAKRFEMSHLKAANLYFIAKICRMAYIPAGFTKKDSG
jgi:hypothetical protein